MSILHSPAVLQDRLQKNLFTPHQKSLVSPFLGGEGFLDDGKKWSQGAEVQLACHFSPLLEEETGDRERALLVFCTTPANPKTL